MEDQDRFWQGYNQNYSVFGGYVRLKRRTMPLIFQFYVPSTMFVLISWISFTIPYHKSERTGMLVTVLLVQVSMYLAVVKISPKGLLPLKKLYILGREPWSSVYQRGHMFKRCAFESQDHTYTIRCHVYVWSYQI